MNLEERPDTSNRLSKAEAQEEAAMLRAKMGMDPRSGKVIKDWRDATAKDYDEALAALEELKALAAQESGKDNYRDVFGRLSVDAASLVAYVINQTLSAAPEWHDKRYWG